MDSNESMSALYSTSSRPRWWHWKLPRSQHDSAILKNLHPRWFRPRRRRSLLSRLSELVSFTVYFTICLVVVTGVLFPSHSHPPQRYAELRRQVERSFGTGAANPSNEKVFIAASLYDPAGQLVSGGWGRSVLNLIQILGPENVFLSLYENDPDAKSKQALSDFEKRLPCDSSVVHEHINLHEFEHVTMFDGSKRLKRIAFLAEVRNRALLPLDDQHSNAHDIRWDKLLFLNDVVFDPIDAANLLFNTNADDVSGKAHYRAACAVDFINPFKFYDTFATRDLEGYSMGLPFYPWFSRAGYGESRRDVLDQVDAVRVKSCWGGMVAFEAKWFQPRLYELEGADLVLPQGLPNSRTKAFDVHDPLGDQIDLNFDSQSTRKRSTTVSSIASLASQTSLIPPLRFRYEADTYWDASECCLIQADLAHLPLRSTVGPVVAQHDGGTGIFMNPYIRVAYSRAVFTWLPFTKRFERLYTPVHTLLNWLAELPAHNPRRLEQPGDEVIDRVWQWDEASLDAMNHGNITALAKGLHGSFQDVTRTARPGQFCGTRKLLYIKHPQDGEGHWGFAKVPRLN